MGERVAVLMDLPDLARTTIRIGGFLHDVGKIAIADRILLKPGPLTDEEYAEMQRHAEIGGDIVSTHEAMVGIAAIVRHHHERFDGRGYPDRLVRDAIPVGARIISIADALSAQTTDRPYRKAIPLDEAWEEIRRHSGTQFDPEVVELFGTLIGTAIVPADPATEGTTIRIRADEPSPAETAEPVETTAATPSDPKATDTPAALEPASIR
jgi:HD-GYP domain-containing protein (c-di-GMP phosphodiesterase class II)